MSRWADDPERAADTLIASCLPEIPIRGSALLTNQTGVVPGMLASRGIDTAIWNRRLTAGATAMPWPPSSQVDTAFLRLPKAKDEVEMSVHALLSVLRPHGQLVVYGGNDEGIRSTARMLEKLTGSVRTLAARGHGRVLATDRPEHMPHLRSHLADWRTQSRVTVAGSSRDWVSYPGLFAAGRVDDGTALLLSVLPVFEVHAKILDFGCGAGVISAAVRAMHPDSTIDMVDNDSVALEAARENVSGARTVLGASLAEAPRKDYHVILSNPPLHDGIAETHKFLEGLVKSAPGHLTSGGILQIVVQRRIALDRFLAEHFGAAEVVAENGRYRVWRAARP